MDINMSNLDLSLINKIMQWEKTKQDHKGGGIFFPLPSNIQNLIPTDGKSNEDDSPHHITILYTGEQEEKEYDRIKSIVQSLCSQYEPFKFKIGHEPRKMVNKEGKTILYMPIFSNRMAKFNDFLSKGLSHQGVQIKNDYNQFKPHITLEYCNSIDESKYKNYLYKGPKEVIIDNVWVWGYNSSKMIMLGA